ncbi:MAG TPA: hypothetical protein VMV10_33215, partial [Pirellulales bacterium]|nr:hypothetical protein [Pirellulales bacterium]
CSTPVGIEEAGILVGAGVDRRRAAWCSTPVGIEEAGMASCLCRRLRSEACSTPVGIEEAGIAGL